MASDLRKHLLIFVISLLAVSCGNNISEKNQSQEQVIKEDSSQVALQFSYEINKDTYLKTNYGQPPQIAIWIESLDSSITKTVFVTHRTAKQDWKGKIECLVSLPYWEYRTSQERQNWDVDMISGATPASGRLTTSIWVPFNSRWMYYIEVNVSADYNQIFSYWSDEGLPDSEANGQPSVVYRGQIIADEESQSIPKLIGHTEQRQPSKKLSKDLEKLTSAKSLIDNIVVTSKLYP